MADTQKTQEFPEELMLYGYPYTTSKDEKRNYIEKKNIEIRLKKGEEESEYIVKDTSKYFWREYNYEFKIVFESNDQNNNNVIYDEDSSIIINDTEYNLHFKSDSGRADIGHKNAKGAFLPSRSSPFIDSLGAAQIQVKIHIDDDNTLCYCSDCYLVESNRKDAINNEADAAITYIAEHYPELFKEDPRISFIGTKISGRSIAERTLKRQMLKDTRKVYERSYAYMRNSPYTHIRNIDKIVPVSRMQSVTPRTVKYIASHTNYLVPAKKGIKYDNDKYCQPTKVLSEQKERTFDVYENRVVMGFLKTILQEIKSMISDTQKEIDALPGSEERNRLEKERDELKDIRSKYVNTQKKYGDIFRINARALRALPQPTPALTATNAYREIYQEIRKWFNGTFVANFCKTLMKFLSTSKLYEYYLLCKMLNSLDDRLPLYRKEIYNIDYLHGDPDVNPQTYTQTRVADVFKYTNGVNELTLYYQPVIKTYSRWIVPNGLWLFRSDPEAKYYMPDYVFKLRNDNSVRYIILDAKYSRPSSFEEDTDKLNEMIDKYMGNIYCYKSVRINKLKTDYNLIHVNDRENENFKKWCSEDIRFQKKIGMIILCGQKEDNCTSSVGRSDYEQYAVLPAVASVEDNEDPAPNMVYNVVQYVVDSFFQPLNVNEPNKPPITLPDLSFQDYFLER